MSSPCPPESRTSRRPPTSSRRRIGPRWPGRPATPGTLGTPALRDAIADRGWVSRPEVIVSTGAKQVIANAMLATLDPGEEVIMPAPYWTSYSDIVRLAGGVPVVVTCPMSEGFKITPDRLDAAITPATRWVMLNSPSNPSGAIYAPEELNALARVLERHPGILILVDEIYAHLNYVPLHVLQGDRAGSGLANPGRGRRLQGVFDDGMAHRLGGRSGRAHHGHGRGPGSGHVRRVLDLPGGRSRRPGHGSSPAGRAARHPADAT